MRSRLSHIASLGVLFSIAVLASAGCSKKEDAATPGKDSAAKPASMDSAKLSAAPATASAISGAAAEGQKIFYSTSYGRIKSACASCHTDGQPTTKDTRLRVGHTLVGVRNRTSAWNGEFKADALEKNAYGATMCAVMYLHKGDDIATVMPKNDIDALNAYYDAIKGNSGALRTDLKIDWVTKPKVHEKDKFDEKAANAAAKVILRLPGDPTAGKEVFSTTCAYCHAFHEKKVGPALDKAFEEPLMGARAIRAGSDAMPFYTKDLLSDQQIADIIAYIQQELGK